MIAAVSKVMTIGIVGYCCMSSVQSGAGQVEKIANLPKRVMTGFELKQIHRLIQYDLVDGSSRSIALATFCREELTASGRDPGTDYWKTAYRLYFNGSLHHEESPVTLSYEKADRYVVMSAGMDKKYLTQDDLTSKSNTDAEVQELMKDIEAMEKKRK